MPRWRLVTTVPANGSAEKFTFAVPMVFQFVPSSDVSPRIVDPSRVNPFSPPCSFQTNA
jgi:hypothetical protein